MFTFNFWGQVFQGQAILSFSHSLILPVEKAAGTLGIEVASVAIPDFLAVWRRNSFFQAPSPSSVGGLLSVQECCQTRDAVGQTGGTQPVSLFQAGSVTFMVTILFYIFPHCCLILKSHTTPGLPPFSLGTLA